LRAQRWPRRQQILSSWTTTSPALSSEYHCPPASVVMYSPLAGVGPEPVLKDDCWKRACNMLLAFLAADV
jgi:hypothetical protein